jgi:hypothetical protein
LFYPDAEEMARHVAELVKLFPERAITLRID